MDSIWLQDAAASPGAAATRLMPALKCDLVIRYGDPFIHHTDRGDIISPAVVWHGIRTRVREVSATGRTGLMIVLLLLNVAAAESIFVERFDDGLDHWIPSPAEKIEIVAEPEAGNPVLQLTPNPDSFAHVLLKKQPVSSGVRVEGRFLFPVDGDGYLGFIYDYQGTEDRMDFGVIYVKPNGSYIRISPHFDGNPSWRLHEEARFDLLNDRKLKVGVWYPFRLDVAGHQASLAIGDLDQPLVTFTGAPTGKGQVGLEARPGRGKPVWVDDIVVSSLSGPPTPSEFVDHPDWQYVGPFEADD